MMNCGYDSRPDGTYDTPPIAPQMWHAGHITCNQTYIAILGALMYRERSGQGQHIDSAIHHAVNVSTEMDIPFFVYNRMPLRRQTGRHASTSKSTNSQALTKDGRYVNASMGIGVGAKAQVDMLREHGVADDMADPKYDDPEALRDPAATRHVNDLIKRWIGAYKLDDRPVEDRAELQAALGADPPSRGEPGGRALARPQDLRRGRARGPGADLHL